MPFRRIVLDVLIPLEPEVLMYAEQLSDLDGINAVGVSVVEQDDKTRTLEIDVEGEDIVYEVLRQAIERIGGAVHSIDYVVAGRRPLEGEPREPGNP